MKNKDVISFFLGWDDVEKRYAEGICIETSSLKYLIEKGKLFAKNLEDLPKVMEGEAIVIPEGIIEGKVMVCIFTETPIPQKWLSSRDLFDANKALMNPEILENPERKNIEFSFELREEEVEVLEEKVVVIVF
ncbi:TPA: hypothetical protein DIC40_02135 [Patescibacteria group bacterium]|nr:hypothetical protein P148_SR1C00001G0260 [candidate division SR1 bacterium RAAC1_SR1_1]HCY20653.1 hypothetical protein [Candidatus Gracilibacteria bacterium]